MADFCAICTDEGGPFRRIEQDGKAITACTACVEEHPRSGRYSFGEGPFETSTRRPAMRKR